MICKHFVDNIFKLAQSTAFLQRGKTPPPTLNNLIQWGCPRDVMVKAMDCRIVISEFVLQSHNYIHFRANSLGKGMNPLILPAMG